MVSAIILAGGRGKRIGRDISKQFILISGKPILYYTIKRFLECKKIDEVVLVLPKDEIGMKKSQKRKVREKSFKSINKQRKE